MDNVHKVLLSFYDTSVTQALLRPYIFKYA